MPRICNGMQLLDVHTTTLHLTRRFTSLHHGDALISSQSDAAWHWPIVSHRIEISWFNLHTSHGSHPHIYQYISYIASQRLNPPAPWGSSQHRKKLKRPQCISVQCAIDIHWSPLIHDREPSVACTAAGEFWILNLWWVLTGWRWIPERPTLQKNWVTRVITCCTCSYWHPLHISSHHPRRPAIHAGSVLWRLVLVERQHRNLWSPPSCNILQPQGSSQSSQWLHSLRPYWLPLGIEHNETRKQHQADLASFTSRSPGCCRTWKDIMERFAKKWRAPILTTTTNLIKMNCVGQTWSNMIKHGLPKHKVVLFISESSVFAAYPVIICVHDILWPPNLSSELSFRRRSSANSMASFH